MIQGVRIARELGQLRKQPIENKPTPNPFTFARTPLRKEELAIYHDALDIRPQQYNTNHCTLDLIGNHIEGNHCTTNLVQNNTNNDQVAFSGECHGNEHHSHANGVVARHWTFVSIEHSPGFYYYLDHLLLL